MEERSTTMSVVCRFDSIATVANDILLPIVVYEPMADCSEFVLIDKFEFEITRT
jgi:hypothetical protein